MLLHRGRQTFSRHATTWAQRPGTHQSAGWVSMLLVACSNGRAGMSGSGLGMTSMLCSCTDKIRPLPAWSIRVDQTYLWGDAAQSLLDPYSAVQDIAEPFAGSDICSQSVSTRVASLCSTSSNQAVHWSGNHVPLKVGVYGTLRTFSLSGMAPPGTLCSASTLEATCMSQTQRSATGPAIPSRGPRTQLFRLELLREAS